MFVCSQTSFSTKMSAVGCVKHAYASLWVHVSWSICHRVVIRQMTFRAGRFVLVTELL